MPTAKGGYFKKDGTPVGSVTQALGCLGFGKEQLMGWSAKLAREGKDFKVERQRSANVGTLVHARIEAFLRNQKPYEATNEEESVLWSASEVPFAGFLQWYDKNRFDLVEAEIPLVHEEYGYGGTLDAVGKTPEGEYVLYDWKTSNQIYGTNFLQAVAYRALWNHHVSRSGIRDQYIDYSIILHIPQGEKPKPNGYEVGPDAGHLLFPKFLDVLSIYNSQEILRPSLYRVKEKK